MKISIVLVSGFLNNHLLPLCEAFQKIGDFRFIATQYYKEANIESKKTVIERSFVLHHSIPYEQKECVSAVRKAHIAIFGGSSDYYLDIRKNTKKTAFIYSENILKKGRYRIFYPPLFRYFRKKYCKNASEVYSLCASSYLADDLKLIGFPQSKCFKFGYFPKIGKIDWKLLLDKKENVHTTFVRLLYVGRLIDLKCVNRVIKTARLLKINKYNFTLDIIGDGPKRKQLENLTKKFDLTEVTFHGLLSQEKVSDFMAKCHILYLSSNRYEGWGAVVNEAMAHGCVVIASSYCGSAKYLIKDGHNGYIAKGNSAKELFAKTILYLKNPQKMQMHYSAYETIWKEWNADIAANRIVQIAKALNKGEKLPNFSQGPLSLATV